MPLEAILARTFVELADSLVADFDVVELLTGPCIDCYTTGEPVVNQNLRVVNGRWPEFVPRALAAGFVSVHALPMRLRDTVIGSLLLLRDEPGDLSPTDLDIAQALAAVATIGILNHRTVVEARQLAEQLDHALNSRVVIEQAKGMLAERAGAEVEDAFEALRDYARRHNLRLAHVAHDLIAGTLDHRELRG